MVPGRAQLAMLRMVAPRSSSVDWLRPLCGQSEEPILAIPLPEISREMYHRRTVDAETVPKWADRDRNSSHAQSGPDLWVVSLAQPEVASMNWRAGFPNDFWTGG